MEGLKAWNPVTLISSNTLPKLVTSFTKRHISVVAWGLISLFIAAEKLPQPTTLVRKGRKKLYILAQILSCYHNSLRSHFFGIFIISCGHQGVLILWIPFFLGYLLNVMPLFRNSDMWVHYGLLFSIELGIQIILIRICVCKIFWSFGLQYQLLCYVARILRWRRHTRVGYFFDTWILRYFNDTWLIHAGYSSNIS